MAASIFATLLAGAGKLFFAQAIGKISIGTWARTVLTPVTTAVCVGSAIAAYTRSQMSPGFVRVVVVFSESGLLSAITIALVGFSEEERSALNQVRTRFRATDQSLLVHTAGADVPGDLHNAAEFELVDNTENRHDGR